MGQENKERETRINLRIRRKRRVVFSQAIKMEETMK
jgi:hypothetical protein